MTGKAKFQQQVPSAGLFLMSMILLLLPLYSAAQDNRHNQVWVDVSAKINLAKGLTLTPEFGYRTEPSIKLNQLYLRTYLSYRLNDVVKLSVWAAQFNASRPENLRAIEVRTSQFVYFFWPKLAGFRFENRLGLDQRMFYQPGYELQGHVHRSRVKIGLHTPQFSLFGSQKGFYANAGFELLRNMNQLETRQWFDHDWITAALGYRVTSSVKIEANMLLINGLDPITNDFEREITVYRLRLKYSLQ